VNVPCQPALLVVLPWAPTPTCYSCVEAGYAEQTCARAMPTWVACPCVLSTRSVFGSACYIESSFPVMLYLANKYAGTRYLDIQSHSACSV
jgi:hypothetical protein